MCVKSEYSYIFSTYWMTIIPKHHKKSTLDRHIQFVSRKSPCSYLLDPPLWMRFFWLLVITTSQKHWDSFFWCAEFVSSSIPAKTRDRTSKNFHSNRCYEWKTEEDKEYTRPNLHNRRFLSFSLSMRHKQNHKQLGNVIHLLLKLSKYSNTTRNT